MMPSAFISHGPPDRVLGNSDAKKFLLNFASLVPTPRAILIISAHWMTKGIRITNTGTLPTIHDFWGFPRALNEVRYEAQQPAWLTELISEQLSSQGHTVQRESRGLDHGAWSVLKLAFPKADIPVAALSLPSTKQLDELFKLGQSLKALRDEGVLIIASGSCTHNLRALSFENSTPPWAEEFTEWLQKVIQRNDYAALCDPYKASKYAEIAHPSIEHYAPLLIAAGAAVNEENLLIHDSFEYGSLNNSSWLFGNEQL